MQLSESRIKTNTFALLIVVMSRHFEQLCAEEHATIMVMVLKGRGLVATALALPHPTSAICRVWSQHVGPA